MTRHNTQTIEIAADAERVHEFLSDGSNLPRWAIGFAKSVERVGDQWVVSTASGAQVPTQVISDETSGTVDFVMTRDAGATATAWARVMPLPSGALFSFTQAQSAEMPDSVFDGNVEAVSHELVALKALLEVHCPR